MPGPTPKLQFTMLLTLTQQGRTEGENAGKELQHLSEVLAKVGKAHEIMMTYGQFDAVICGECVSQEQLAAFVALVNDDGFYSTETLLGFEPEWFVPGRHGS